MFLDPDVTRYIHLKAMVGDHFTVRKLLEEDPSKVHSTNGRLTVPPLFYACRYGHLKVCQVLLEFRANLHHQVQGWAPLHEACAHNHVHVVEFLLSNGVDPDAALKYSGMTALMHAARRNFVPTCRLLVERGADLWARNVDGKTALEFATEPGSKVYPYLEREMKREMLWKAWAITDKGLGHHPLPLPTISYVSGVLHHVLQAFPQDLFVECLTYL